uniref:Transposon MuDR mudrA n=1 Tax=Solanum tuberosum TaxID=4113 RepID=M1CWQ0_SOLTU
MYYGGCFLSDPELRYANGISDLEKIRIDMDELHIMFFHKLARELGVEQVETFGCKVNKRGGFYMLKSDADVLRFINNLKGGDFVDVYVVHQISTPLIVEDPTEVQIAQLLTPKKGKPPPPTVINVRADVSSPQPSDKNDTNIKEDQQPSVDKGATTGGNGGATTSAASIGVTTGGSGGATTKRPTTTSAASGGATTAATTTGGRAANISLNFASVAQPTSQFSTQQSTTSASGSNKSSKVKRGGANPGYKRPRTEKPRTAGFGVLFGANGSVIERSGTTDRVLHCAPLKSSVPTNIDLGYKPNGLRWKGGAAVTQRQLQEQSYKRATQSTPSTQDT